LRDIHRLEGALQVVDLSREDLQLLIQQAVTEAIIPTLPFVLAHPVIFQTKRPTEPEGANGVRCVTGDPH
jgi:hypothetical protein